MKSKILKQIKEIEKVEDIKILYLIESGSRAWGWESKDSDYDIRGVYVQNYNQLKDLKSQINLINDNLDIVLWDLKKFLGLMMKSNPCVWEWLSSELIYIDHPIRLEFKNAYLEGSSKFDLKKHYISMARQNFNKYINQDKDLANLKKYLYVLRSIACANYIEATTLPPPKNYKEVIPYLPKNISDFFEKIIEEKKESESLKGERNKLIDQYIISLFDKQFEKDNPKFTNPKELFDKCIKEVKK